MSAADNRLSKTVSHALRHQPSAYGLVLDEAGWAPVDALVDGLRRRSARWGSVQRDDLERIARQDVKQRFEIAGDRIRARYGHSGEHRIVQLSEPPPARLYHGTTQLALDGIRLRGLQPMRRQYVHLSVDVPTARAVGRRRSRSPVVLEVAAVEAYRAGVFFSRGSNAVWLAGEVPARFVRQL